MILTKIEVVSDFKHLQILEKSDTGENHRRVLCCDMDVSSEVQEIQNKASELWTDEVKASWVKHLEDQKME